MQNEPLVSVVIPTYNRSRTICASVNSVLNQTYKNIELIVVDDCSTDDTEKTIRSMSDTRIKYIKLERNSGACVARNTGIEKAAGTFTAFNDSDDEWLPEKIKNSLISCRKTTQTLFFARWNAELLKTNLYIIFQKLKKTSRFHTKTY